MYNYLISFLLSIFIANNTYCMSQELIDSPEITHEFLRASARGEYEKVVQFINQGININAKNSDKVTALHCSANFGHDNIVKLLLANDNTDINAQTGQGYTPLHLAVYPHARIYLDFCVNNEEEQIKELRENFKELPYYSTIRLLLKAGADTSIKDKDNFIATELAQKKAYEEREFHRTQIESSTKLFNMEQQFQKLALASNISSQILGMDKMFDSNYLEQTKLEMQCYLVKATALEKVANLISYRDQMFQAIEKNNLEKFKQLALQISFYIKDTAGNTPLHKAIAKNNIKMINIIANIAPSLLFIENKSGVTALRQLIEKRPYIIKSLLNLEN